MGKSTKRPKISKETETAVLTKCRRKCCICYYLDRDDIPKQGQIAHLDHDRSNNAEDNLAWLCLPHHDQYDTRTSQSKGITEEEVRFYRRRLHEQIILCDAAMAAGNTSKETVTTVISRYEELLEIRQKDLEDLRSDRDSKTEQLKLTEQALRRAEERAREDSAILHAAKQTKDVFAVKHAIKADAAVRRILILEGFAMLGEATKRVLMKFGYEATHVESSAAAITELTMGSYDILITERWGFAGDPNDQPLQLKKVLATAASRSVASIVLISYGVEREIVINDILPNSVTAIFLKGQHSVDDLMYNISVVAEAKASGKNVKEIELCFSEVPEGEFVHYIYRVPPLAGSTDRKPRLKASSSSEY